jgi:hypothetical protein
VSILAGPDRVVSFDWELKIHFFTARPEVKYQLLSEVAKDVGWSVLSHSCGTVMDANGAVVER